MIKINKSPNVPATLQSAPVPTCAGDVLKNVYKADDVRTQLDKDQHHKCCYCECVITKAFNDVEHYRPKSHYYWLGYDWNNLLYSCDLCNRTFKKGLFPLLDEAVKANTPADNISLEHPLIINPAKTDPALHIKFRRYQAVGITVEGNKTIKVFDLDNKRGKRPELIEERKQVYELYQKSVNIITKLSSLLSRSDIPSDAKVTISDAIREERKSINIITSPSHAYSGMLIAQI